MSQLIGRELAIAGKNEIDIIPFKTEDAQLSGKCEYCLVGIQWYNAIGASLESHLKKLLNIIEVILEKIESRHPPKPEVECRFFRGVYLPKPEVEVLKEIESLTGESFE